MPGWWRAGLPRHRVFSSSYFFDFDKLILFVLFV